MDPLAWGIFYSQQAVLERRWGFADCEKFAKASLLEPGVQSSGGPDSFLLRAAVLYYVLNNLINATQANRHLLGKVLRTLEHWGGGWCYPYCRRPDPPPPNTHILNKLGVGKDRGTITSAMLQLTKTSKTLTSCQSMRHFIHGGWWWWVGVGQLKPEVPLHLWLWLSGTVDRWWRMFMVTSAR